MYNNSYEEEEISGLGISHSEFFMYVVSLDKRITELEKKLRNIDWIPLRPYENIKEEKN
jgi:hypothetical protein